MAKPKLTFSVAPTFKAIVQIPIAGEQETVPVEFEFRHRTRSDLDAWNATVREAGDRITLDRVKEMAAGWELEESFDDEHISQLLELYGGSGLAIYFAYNRELQDAKLGNSVK